MIEYSSDRIDLTAVKFLLSFPTEPVFVIFDKDIFCKIYYIFLRITNWNGLSGNNL